MVARRIAALAALAFVLGCSGGGADPESGTGSGSSYADVVGQEAASARAAVTEAIDHYDSEGMSAALERHNSVDSIEGDRYVFVVNVGSERMVAHWDPERRGVSLRDWLGTDIYGYEFGTEMLSADENGKWVTYTFVPPDALGAGDFGEGTLQIKHSWVQRHDGLLFGSGWYMDAEGFIEVVVNAAANEVSPDEVPDDLTSRLDLGGLAEAIPASVAYYNATDVSEGRWLGFVAAHDGVVVSAEHNPELVGTDITDLLGDAVIDEASESGTWIETPNVKVFAQLVDNFVIAAGWYDPAN